MPIDKEEAFSQARNLLLANGFPCEVSLKDLDDWFNAQTANPDASQDEVFSEPLLVAHEIVEVTEVKRMGLSITKDVILKNPDRVYEAHLSAFEVELELAKDTHNRGHIQARLKDVRSWCEDPFLPSRLKARCRMLQVATEESLKDTVGR